MDKYQEKFLESMCNPTAFCNITKEDYIQSCIKEKKQTNAVKVKTDFGNGIITIYQNEDITLTSYHIVIRFANRFNSPIKCSSYHNNMWMEEDTVLETPFFVVSIDLNNPIEKIKIESLLGLIEPIEFTVNLILANIDAYYEKQITMKTQELLEKAAIRHSTGMDLVNIYFQPCSDKYDHSNIQLYSTLSDSINRKSTSYQLLAKYDIDSDVYFKGINGLAYGNYAYTLTQYDQEGNILIQTDKIVFSISQPNYGGKPVIVG